MSEIGGEEGWMFPTPVTLRLQQPWTSTETQ